jgi:hypothetical protein
MVNIKFRLTCLIISLVSTVPCLSQAVSMPMAAQIATLNVSAASKSYRLGDTIVLEATLTNVSPKDIGFQESAAGTFDVEVYDVAAESPVDMLQSLRRPNEKKRGASALMEVATIIEPGKSLTRQISVSTTGLVTHPGRYKFVVNRREVDSKVLIVSNPLILSIATAGPTSGGGY